MKRFFALSFVLLLAACSGESATQPALVFDDALGDATAAAETSTENDLAGGELAAPDALPPGPDLCAPDCGERLCGDDGCGGSCGSCPEGEFCAEDGQCWCDGGCQGRECGRDPCGVLFCGACPSGMRCDEQGQCYQPCVPVCGDRCAGDDGCGGECPNVCERFGVDCDPATQRCEPFSACDQPGEPPLCESVAPAPAGWEEQKSFLRLNATPLRCEVGDREWWDFSVLAREFAGMRLFMFGEVHGSQELGPLSASLFEHLVRSGLVDSFSIEIGIDLGEPIREYLATGGGPLVTDYYFDHWPRNMMWTSLINKARELVQEGFALEAFGCDTPMRLAYVNEQIEQLAAGLTSTRALVLDSLPQPGPAVWQEISRDYLAAARAYAAHIAANLEPICDELDDADDCERLAILAETVWLGAFSAYSGMANVSDQAFYEFLARREPLIYHSYRHAMTDGRRVYTHMGAFHTAKAVDPRYSYESAGALLANTWPDTQGKVYTTTPNYGEGSRISYGGEILSVPPDPSIVAAALEEETSDRYFLSLTLPGGDCRATPLAQVRASATGVALSATYDAMIFIRRLTPQGGFKAALPPALRRGLARFEAVRAAEERLLPDAP